MMSSGMGGGGGGGGGGGAYNCNSGFSNSYMLLNTEEVKFLDLFRLLFSSNLKKRRFVDSSRAREHNFWHRFFIFLSIIVLKLLRFFDKPLALLGFLLESSLNFLSANGGFSGVLFNFLRFKLKIPDSSSAEYLSMIGHLDSRVTLDKSIKPGDVNYFGALCMMASKLAYENEAHVTQTVNNIWKMEFLGFFNFWNDYQEKCSTQAFMMRDKKVDHDTIIVSFRGTEPFNADDWSSDFDISWYEIKGMGKIHGGFMKALGLQKCIGWPKEIKRQDHQRRSLAYYTLREKLKELMKENERTRFVVTGHSLGGALAILFPSILVFHEEKLLLERLEGVYTFGQPRVGDREFGEFMVKSLSQYNIRYYRFVYGFDMVPRLPLDDKALMFKHFGPCIYFDWNYDAQILEEEPFKNYFSIVGAVLMRIHACLEIGRSFTIAWRRGKDYEEKVFFRIVRLFGLLLPGIPAHCPQDYVNSTRLGSTDRLHSEYDVKIQ
ncbi:triacylglycerol lipase OBL1-like isoform X1 [Benincasa hispida]|uniref:triacylglycerol lipase OBL1-like isoform X1 n=1 Tax=Benincasa hispida TaxID=102211 RepID=UPI0018FFF9FA|nr:triacylglycerol lipase OBL1-like isoform X1 [Benincasa hispida]